MSIPATGNLKQASKDPSSRTTYAHAVREYDPEFQRHLVAEIVNAIAEASIVTDPNLRVMALRVGETLEALTTVLVSFAAMSPHFDVPSHLREFAEALAKRIRRDVAKARAEGGLGRDFIFGAQRQGGSA
jgi:hypothetical protein